MAEAKAQDERKSAEQKRALADVAYKDMMGLTNEQFVQLELIKVYHQLGLEGKSSFIVGNIPGFTLNK